MINLEKMTKEELKDLINNLNKVIEDYKEQVAHLIEQQDELHLLKFLYKDYVFAIEESERIRKDCNFMENRIRDLQDLCDRQQKIIDSRCN